MKLLAVILLVLKVAFAGGAMRNFILSMARFIREEEGASTVEYAVLVVLIAVAVVVVVYAVGQQVSVLFQSLLNCQKNPSSC